MEKIFESLINVAPIIIEMFEGNAGICICNENECIYDLDGKNVKAAMKAGYILDKNILEKTGIINNIYTKKKTVTQVFNEKEHGIDLKATAIPAINEKEEVIGWISIKGFKINFKTEEKDHPIK